MEKNNEFLNKHLGRATIAEGVSKQNSHPFKVMQKRHLVDCLYGLVYLSYASYDYQNYWLCDRCERALMLKNISCRQWHQSVITGVNVMIYWC